MFSTYVRFTNSTREDLVDHYDTVEDAVLDSRVLWNEDNGNLHVLIRDEQGECVALMVKDASYPQLCETRYADGRIEYHRCHPWVDNDSGFLRSWIEALALVPAA